MNLLGEKQWKKLEIICTSAEQKMFTTTKVRQEVKFQPLKQSHLQASNTTGPRDMTELVNNLSSRTLMQPESQVLALGLNFNIPSSTVPVNEFITSTEAVVRKLDSNTAKQLRTANPTAQPYTHPDGSIEGHTEGQHHRGLAS